MKKKLHTLAVGGVLVLAGVGGGAYLASTGIASAATGSSSDHGDHGDHDGDGDGDGGAKDED